jgi:predicted RNA-binding protein
MCSQSLYAYITELIVSVLLYIHTEQQSVWLVDVLFFVGSVQLLVLNDAAQ